VFLGDTRPAEDRPGEDAQRDGRAWYKGAEDVVVTAQSVRGPQPVVTQQPQTTTSEPASGPEAIWPPFVAASIALALSGGFALGAGLFVARWLGDGTGRWWIAASQAHGQVQLLGWIGLMVLGVAFHFLPRLAGVPLRWPRMAGVALWLIVAGLALRGITQPLLSAGIGAPMASLGLVVAAGLLLAGVTLAVVMLVATIRNAPPRKTGALRQVRPLFLVSFGSLWVGAVLSAYGLVAAERGAGVVSASLDRIIVEIEFYGFLVPVAAAMTARTFPLYFQTHPPRARLLVVPVAGLVCGVVLRATGDPSLVAVGQILHGAALAWLIAALRVFGPRRPLPRRPARPLRDPLQLHAVSAYAWLAVAGGASLLAGLHQIGLAVPAVPADVEWHALGAGFATLLILGVGSHMLPGFARRELRSAALPWVTLAAGNLAVMLRVAAGLTGQGGAWLGGLAGVLGMLVVALFAVNVHGPRR